MIDDNNEQGQFVQRTSSIRKVEKAEVVSNALLEFATLTMHSFSPFSRRIEFGEMKADTNFGKTKPTCPHH
jgi:hypothetical protein